jgi:hypothetical protein
MENIPALFLAGGGPERPPGYSVGTELLLVTQPLTHNRRNRYAPAESELLYMEFARCEHATTG